MHLIFILLLSLAAQQAQASSSSWIIKDPDNPATTTEIPGGKLPFVMELGDPWQGQLTLPALKDAVTWQKVEFKYETSITIMDEGPHLDLTDWKHYHSEWIPAKMISQGVFEIKLNDSSGSQFPFVAKSEFIEAVKKSMPGKSKWLDLANKCETPNTYPCGVSISRVWIKATKSNGETQEREMHIAMGC